MKEIIALDIGNVLYKLVWEEFNQFLIEHGNYTSANVNEFIDNITIHLDLGVTTLKNELNKNNLSLKKGYDIWLRVIQRHDEVLKYIDGLLSKKDIILLSNIGHEHAALLRKDSVINKCRQYFSCEMGTRKPNKLFYQSVYIDLQRLGIWQENIKYVDDLLPNLSASEGYLKPNHFNLHDYKTGPGAAIALARIIN